MVECFAQNTIKEQFPRNLLANIANFTINFMVGLFLTPYFIGTLGTAAYGLIPLATSLTSYVSVITDSLNQAVSRFLTVDLHRQDYEKANRTFNTALFGVSGIIVLLIPGVVLLAYFAPMFFNVPAGQEFQVILLFLGVFSSFLIRSWSGNFTVSLFAYNRLDLQNLLNMASTIFQVSLIFFLFAVFSPQLSFIGLAYLAGSIFFLLGAIFLSARTNSHLHVNLGDFDRSRLKELTHMGSWVTVASIGSMLFGNIALMVVNKIFGATAGGEYAIALQWNTVIIAISISFIGVLTPIILTYYARGETESLKKVTSIAVKLMVLFLALPIGLLCGLAPEVLVVWIGKDFVFLAPLMVILVAPLVVNMGVQPLCAISSAYNRVKIPGIVTVLLGIGNLISAIVLSLYTNWGFYGIAISCTIFISLKCAVFTPWYTARILGTPIRTLVRPMFPGIIALVIIAGTAFGISREFEITNLPSLVFIGVLFSAIYLAAIWLLALDDFERELFISYLPSQIQICFYD
jgi:O-antigen/teichoic acid export membrane protein